MCDTNSEFNIIACWFKSNCSRFGILPFLMETFSCLNYASWSNCCVNVTHVSFIKAQGLKNRGWCFICWYISFDMGWYYGIDCLHELFSIFTRGLFPQLQIIINLYYVVVWSIQIKIIPNVFWKKDCCEIINFLFPNILKLSHIHVNQSCAHTRQTT
jgi:hypothetical protein